MHIQPVSTHERAELLGIAIRTGLFAKEEAESLLGSVLDGLAASELPSGHTLLSCYSEPESKPIGWCYFAPDDHAAAVWNLWWIGVDPQQHGGKAGIAMLRAFEDAVIGAQGRLLVVETSDSDALERARRFYARAGYQECGRVPHFYSESEAKVIFARRLPGAA